MQKINSKFYWVLDTKSGECLFLAAYPNNESAFRAYRYHFQNSKDFYILKNVSDFKICWLECSDLAEQTTNWKLTMVDFLTVVDPLENKEFKAKLKDDE